LSIEAVDMAISDENGDERRLILRTLFKGNRRFPFKSILTL